MIKNQDIVCISSIDWDFIWQGHQEIMSAFAKNGNRVLFIENTGIRVPYIRDIGRLKKRVINWFKNTKGFRKEMENLYVYSPVILPFPYSKIARWINRRMLIRPIENWIKIMGFHDYIVWTFLPTGTALDIIRNIGERILVYYCIADFYQLADNPKKVEKRENELIIKSDLVFVQGEVLEEKCRRLNDNVYKFPFGVNMEIFENFHYNPSSVPADIKKIKKPIIGYIGGVHKHIDFKLLKFIAEKHPEWSIVLIGPMQTNIEEINNLQNIFLLGKKDFSELPYYINEFGVCMIPYNKTEYTMTVYPTKLNEYHALGKPVVSTELPEIVNFNIENNNMVLVGKTYEEFTNYVSRALNEHSGSLVNERKSCAKKNSWVNRIEEMSDLMEEAIDKKSKMFFDWQESFLKFYRIARKKISRIAVVSLSAYLIVFYTPLVWFLAEPLKISQIPQKADAIVVFAGGVGESGKAGQGYEERLKYAIELYRNGYAKHMIFSSGYTYVFDEAAIMKALAISLGVPEQTIILENKAKNTYENIKFSKDILDKNGWNRILLISSPYHMRRTSLVFKKIAGNIKVTYAYVPYSMFYAHPGRDEHGRKIWKQTDLLQIKGILHEYLGIIYYWYKGRI